MVVITGGAGLIGSALLWGLNERGQHDIIVVDNLDHEEKEKNLAPLAYEELLSIADFRDQLLAGDLPGRGITTVFHLGAITSTTTESWERLLEFNVSYTQDVIRWCVDQAVQCLYASSGQVYGSGEQGYSDDHALFDQLKAITLYGRSKLLVDVWARDAGYLDRAVGLRYFNVFGPNENHKGPMRSVIAKQFETITRTGQIELFRSYRKDWADGQQQRDFIYIKDAVAATLFFFDHPELAGMYNIGTGQARSWNDVARAMFAALGKPAEIRYVDMPANLKENYQYFTQADITKLRAAGYRAPFTPLEEAVRDYIQLYLEPHKHLGE